MSFNAEEYSRVLSNGIFYAGAVFTFFIVLLLFIVPESILITPIVVAIFIGVSVVSFLLHKSKVYKTSIGFSLLCSMIVVVYVVRSFYF